MGSPRLVVFYPRRFLFPDKVSHPLFTRFLRRDRETACLLRRLRTPRERDGSHEVRRRRARDASQHRFPSCQSQHVKGPPHTRGAGPRAPPAGGRRDSHVSKGRKDRPGFGRPSLRTRFQRTPNLCARDDTKHPWGGGGGRQGPADAIGFFQRQAASQPAAGLKATPPLQLFNELGTLWFPSAKPDNTKARVSQTRPPPFQRSLSPKRKRACFQRDRTMSSPLWRTVRTLKAGSTRVAG